MNIIEQEIIQGLIKFDETRNFMPYLHQNIKRNYDNQEVKVQAETFLTLVLIYGYPEKRIKQFVSVKMGSETKEADLIVHHDDKHEETYNLAEYKKEDLTDRQFNIAVDQAYSYAVAEGAKYVWTTSRIKNQYYDTTGRETQTNELVEIGKELAQFIVHINETE